MELHRIKLHELTGFLSGGLYQSLTVKPFAPLRAASYLQNPKALPSDVVLYMLTDGDEMLAFRTLWADTLLGGEDPVRFAWLSGNWVRPDLRQKGYALQLLQAAMTDWDGRLMFTNYSPLSLQSYQRSGLFYEWYMHRGIRAYRAPNLTSLLAHRRLPALVKRVIPLADSIVRGAARLKVRFYRPAANPDYRFELLAGPDEASLQLADKQQSHSAFATGSEQLLWKHQWPWLSVSPGDYLPDYPFSSFASRLLYTTVKVFFREHFSGFFIVSIREDHLKTHYFYLSSLHRKAAAQWIADFAMQQNVNMVTILHHEVAKSLKMGHHPFLLIRPFHMGIYATQLPRLEGAKQVHEGDGDYFFT